MAGSRRSRLLRIGSISVPVLALAALGLPATQAQAQAGAGARLVGTSSASTGAFTPSGAGDATQAEFVGETDGGTGAPTYPGVITDRSLSSGHGSGASISAPSGPRAKSNPQLKGSFEGLNLFQQRYARGGNQFTVEPPDQALCVGNGHVLEAVNDVLNVYDKTGASQLPDNTATNIVAGFPQRRGSRGRPQLVLRLRPCDQPLDRRSEHRRSPTLSASSTRPRSASSSRC